MQNALSVGLLIMFGAVIGIAGAYFALAVRRWARSTPTAETFTLQDLREMRERGELQPREFEALRARMFARAQDTRAESKSDSGSDGR